MKAILASASACLLLTSCGPKSLELPADPVERAATCGAAQASAERVATNDINTDLSIDAIGRVMHFPMLAAADGGTFDSGIAKQVQNRMSEIQDKVSGGKWEDLAPQCRAAFPASAIDNPALPADRFDALLGCNELGDFLRSALAKQGKYDNELSEYYAFGNSLEGKIGPGLRARAGSDLGNMQGARDKALATIVRAGPPIAVMKQCIETFG